MHLPDFTYETSEIRVSIIAISMQYKDKMIFPILYIYDLKLNDRFAAYSAKDVSSTIRTEVLSDHLNIPAEALQFTKLENGKPVLSSHPEYSFSVSHSGNIWAILICKGENVGLDIELHKPRKMMNSVIREYFHPEETAAYNDLPAKSAEQTEFFFKLWTQKEAYAKFLGLGLSYDFSSRSFLTDSPQDAHIISRQHMLDHSGQKISVSIVFETLIKNLKIKCNFNDVQLMAS